jgi:hypothetical protein
MIGAEIKDLAVETAAHFNVRGYLGLDAADGPGYEQVAYTVRRKMRGAMPDQLTELRRACEQALPVADMLYRCVAIDVPFAAR